MTTIRSRAPLRLGMAGGGTDVSPYSDSFGGCVLNATISLYAHCTIETGDHIAEVIFDACDFDISETFSLEDDVVSASLILHAAVYSRIVNDYCEGKKIPLKITTYSESPPGSGLGSSSAVVVAMIEAYKQLLGLPLGEYDVAHLAYEIERIDCGMSGGKQDQYAATFGGFNFIEFFKDKVIVNPLRIRRNIVSEIEESLILFFTGVSRTSSDIILDQMKAIEDETGKSLQAMNRVKESAFKMKEYILKGDIQSMINEVNKSWAAKKKTSASISNENIDRISSRVFEAGASALKISGAGGGGFMMIFVDPVKRQAVERALHKENGQIFRAQFINEGAYAWTI